MERSTKAAIKLWTWIIIFLSLFISGWAVGCPKYRVWEQGMTGQANLRRAEQERQILVEQARAERDAATLQAEAIQIVGQAAKEFPEYRQQMFMQAYGEALQNKSIDKIIFVPTESGVPQPVLPVVP